MANNETVKTVESMQYSLPSMQKSNVDMTNSAMGYHDKSDRANTGTWPNGLQGAKVNKQPLK